MSLASNVFDRDHGTSGGDPCDHAALSRCGTCALSSIASTALVKVAIRGFWDERLMRAFAHDFVAEMRKVDSGENRHLVLVDLSSAAIQSQDVFEAFRAMLVGGQTTARRLAIFTGSVPMRMEARRVTTLRQNIALFDSEAKAMAWLMEGAE